MPRDILGEFGPDASKQQHARAGTGGIKQARDVMNYSPPKGPSNIGDPKGPGLHGDNYGHGQMHHPKSEMGHPGIGKVSHGNKGSQR